LADDSDAMQISDIALQIWLRVKFNLKLSFDFNRPLTTDN